MAKSQLIKIFYITHTQTDVNLDGATRDLFLIASSLNRSLFEPVFLTPTPGLISPFLRKAKIKEINVPMWKTTKTVHAVSFSDYFIKTLCTGFSLMHIFNIEKPQIAHVNCNVNFWGAFIPKLVNIPVLWHIREYIENDRENRTYCSFFQSFSTRVFTTARHNKQHLIEGGVSKRKIRIIPSSLEIKPLNYGRMQRLRKHIFRRFSIPLHVKIVGFVGRIRRDKGIREFIEMAAAVSNVYPEVLFLIFGSFELSSEDFGKEIKYLISTRGINDKVIFMGTFAQTEEIYSCLDILVTPFTRIEPFGRVITEAMERGIPVVSFDRGGPSEIIKHEKTGILVPHGNMKALMKAVLDLINNPDKRREISCRARKDAVKRFDIKKLSITYRKIYQDILKKNDYFGHYK